MFLILPDYFPHYQATLIESGFIDKPGGFEYFEDLDHDGYSERIILFNNRQDEASIKIVEKDGSIGDHYYFRGQILTDYLSCSFSDYDSTGVSRIFLITLSHDSLLLHCVEPVRKKDVEFRDRYIVKVCPRNGMYDFQITGLLFSDLDGDGNRELITDIMAGFPLKPRISMILDLARDTLIRSVDKGMFYYILTAKDINGDGRKELIPFNYSIFNYPDSASDGMTDRKARIMVFDDQFNFLFPPIDFPGKYIHVYTCPLKTKTGEYVLVSLITQSSSGSIHPRLILSDITGRQLAERRLPDLDKKSEYSLFFLEDSPDLAFILDGKGSVEEIMANLKSRRKIKLDDQYAGYRNSLDVDQDGNMELIGYTGLHRMPTIFRNDFSHPVKLELPAILSPWYIGVQKRGKEPSRIFIQQVNNYSMFEYGRNPLFYLQYPFYTGIFLGFLAIILFSQYLQRILLKQRYDAEKKITEQQLLLLNNQIDPHFTFNAINTISASILSGKPLEANKNLLSLSWLMRSCVSHSDKLSRSLADELNFVNHYLDLMKTRMVGDFEFSIEIAPEVDLSWQVPKMAVQIYAENAIKHGLRPKGTGGELVISVSSGQSAVGSSQSAEGSGQWAVPSSFVPRPSSLVPRPSSSVPPFHFFTIAIEDNGIGRKQAQLTGSSGTGRGLQIMEQFYATFNTYNKQKIRSEIIDLEDDAGNALGTRVEITVPVGMRYVV